MNKHYLEPVKKKRKRELIEWIVLLSVIGIIYLNGWHTEILGKVQQAVLATGVITPTLSDKGERVSYAFELESATGKIVPFTNFQDQVVFVNFWATWCPPCIAEMPDIHSLYLKQREKVAFVMISLDEDKAKANAFLKRKAFDFPVYFLNSPLPATFQVTSIPSTYLLDKAGNIQAENHGMAKYDTEAFNELLERLSEVE